MDMPPTVPPIPTLFLPLSLHPYAPTPLSQHHYRPHYLLFVLGLSLLLNAKRGVTLELRLLGELLSRRRLLAHNVASGNVLNDGGMRGGVEITSSSFHQFASE